MSMRISFSTGIYYHLPLRYSLGLAHELGYDGVEWVVHPGYVLRGLEPVRRAFAESGVRALSVHPPFYRMPGWPRRWDRATERTGALARYVGAELFVVHAALLHSLESPRASQYVSALSRGSLASGPGIVIGVETGQHTKRRLYLLDDLPTLVAFCQEHHCGITFDTCHAGANGEDLLESYAIVKPVMRNVHLSDVVWKRGHPHTHRLPGEGDLPLAAFLQQLARDGYDGIVTVESHPRLTGPLSRAEATRRLGQALDFVRAHTASQVRSGAANSTSGEPIPAEE